MNDIDKVIDLLLDASRPRTDYPSGELDRMRENQIASWNRLNAAGILGETELQALISQFDSNLDYQRDHPLNEIDEMLDSAIALAFRMNINEYRDLTELIDDPVRARLHIYSVRSASRALACQSVAQCRAGLFARILAINSGDCQLDSRDLMVSLSPLHVAALGKASLLFGQLAWYVSGDVSETMKKFAERKDVTLEAFGWTLVQKNSAQWIVLASFP